MQGRIISGFSAFLDFEFSLSLILLNVTSEKGLWGKGYCLLLGTSPKGETIPLR